MHELSGDIAATERTRGASNLIEVKDEHQLVLQPPQEGDSRENARATKKKSMPFSFDRSYDENTEQRELFEYVGLELLEHSFNGFNTVSGGRMIKGQRDSKARNMVLIINCFPPIPVCLCLVSRAPHHFSEGQC